MFEQFIDFFLHTDHYLSILIGTYGLWTYAILFLIIFCETGLVVTPFLPGDSLLFTAGAVVAISGYPVHSLVVILIGAAVLGDLVNYQLGRKLGIRAFEMKTRFLNQNHLRHVQLFYERHGGKAILLARFVPIARTFAPFVAGIGQMRVHRFAMFNVTGGILWVVLFVYAGYFFGSIPIIKDNLIFVALAIVLISILPGIIAFVRSHLSRRRLNTTMPEAEL